MALLVKAPLKDDYVQVPNETAKAVEEKTNTAPISLEALGLITNLWSYDIYKWEVRKTELYKRFAKNKKTSVMSAWDDLVEAKYIIEFKYRSGKKWEYVYIYRIKPFTDEEIQEKLEECVELAGVSSTSDFENLKLGSSKCASQNQHISNEKEKKEKPNKNNNKNFVNKEENQNVTENYFSKGQMLETADKFYSEFARGRWSKNQWFTITDKLTTEISDRCIAIKNLEAYIYAALKQIAYKHDYKNGKVEFEYEQRKGEVPFYDWLNNWDMEDL